jgi:hypothetical protein
MNRFCAPQGRSALGFNLVFGVLYNSLLTRKAKHLILYTGLYMYMLASTGICCLGIYSYMLWPDFAVIPSGVSASNTICFSSSVPSIIPVLFY